MTGDPGPGGLKILGNSRSHGECAASFTRWQDDEISWRSDRWPVSGNETPPSSPIAGRSARDETGLEMAVCHFPPGNSKRNKIEHHLFSAITQNWRGKPLSSHETVVNLIGATTTGSGLKVRSKVDENVYPAGVSVRDAEMETLHLRTDEFHGEWNYSLLPRPQLLTTD